MLDTPLFSHSLTHGARGRAIGMAALCIASALIFVAYTRPDFVVNMANQIWLCF